MKFYSLLLLKALAMIAIILFAGIGLGPDEAQYWTWSRQLDIGYYSKPPGVAWQIFLSTGLLGSTELGVRFSAVVLGTLFSIAVYRLGLNAGLPKDSSVIAGLIAAFTPLGIFSTFLAITDGGLLLFWTLGLGVLVYAIHENKTPSYPLIGLYIALGALFKWPIYLFWVAVLLAWIIYPQVRSKTIVAGIFISLLGLLPTLIWNSTHDFATFRHVFSTVKGGDNVASAGNPLEFIGSQIGIISPIIFVLGVIALFYIKKQPPAVRFLALVTICFLGLNIGYSFFKKGQGNWCLYAYPSLFVVIAAVFERRGWIKAGLVFSVLLVLSLFSIPAIQKNGWFANYQIPWKINPFRHNLGWENLALDPDKAFLFADKYQNTSLLSFYNSSQEQAYFFNLLGSRKNQFSYWSAPTEGQDGLFVVVENGADLDEKMKELEVYYKEALAPYFEKIHEPRRVDLFRSYGKSVKQALIFPCENFSGALPLNPEKY